VLTLVLNQKRENILITSVYKNLKSNKHKQVFADVITKRSLYYYFLRCYPLLRMLYEKQRLYMIL
jgi:hypothetical protein